MLRKYVLFTHRYTHSGAAEKNIETDLFTGVQVVFNGAVWFLPWFFSMAEEPIYTWKVSNPTFYLQKV